MSSKKITSNELEALQNAASVSNLVINENFTQDKRVKIKKYFATLNGLSVSPTLEYNLMNHFLLGWNNSKRYEKG